MGNLTLNGATSGQITLAPPSVAGTNTLTFPAKTGNIITSADTGTVSQTMLATNVGATGPAFSAYVSSAQSISTGTDTKITFQSEYFDTNSNFDNTTNYRFTPTVAGYYQLSCAVTCTGNLTGESLLFLYKNGSRFARLSDLNGSTYGANGSILVYANGSSDYFEVYFRQNTGSSQTTNAGGETAPFFTGALVRGA